MAIIAREHGHNDIYMNNMTALLADSNENAVKSFKSVNHVYRILLGKPVDNVGIKFT